MNSMTGFGRGEAIAEGVIWRAEVSSVNRKQLEIVINLPRELNELETGLRNSIAGKLSRGRVYVAITADRGSASKASLRVDETLARQYADALTKLSSSLHIPSSLSTNDIIRWPGVFTIEQSEVTAEQAQPFIEKAVSSALEQMLTMRGAEGQHLKEDMSARLDALELMFTEAA